MTNLKTYKYFTRHFTSPYFQQQNQRGIRTHDLSNLSQWIFQPSQLHGQIRTHDLRFLRLIQWPRRRGSGQLRVGIKNLQTIFGQKICIASPKRRHTISMSLPFGHISDWVHLKTTITAFTYDGEIRIARLFSVQYTKAGKNIPNDYKITKWP
jgi:hypothetical protein